MTFSIAALLAQDGVTNGAIYALLALALVLVFTVTRVIFVPAGEFVAWGTLTLAGLQLGKAPGIKYANGTWGGYNWRQWAASEVSCGTIQLDDGPEGDGELVVLFLADRLCPPLADVAAEVGAGLE